MSCRVWVTREESSGGPLCLALAAQGLVPVCEPVIARRACSDAAAELTQLNGDDWLVLTSPFAIECVHESFARIPKVAVVGEKSAAAARARGFRVELVSPGKGAGALFEALRSVAAGRRVLYPRSSEAAAPDVECFGELISLVLYETCSCDFDIGIIDKVDCVTFASPSAVRAVDARVRLAGIGLAIASIGPTTSAAVLECGGVVAAEAEEPGFVDLAMAVAMVVAGLGEE